MSYKLLASATSIGSSRALYLDKAKNNFKYQVPTHLCIYNRAMYIVGTLVGILAISCVRTLMSTDILLIFSKSISGLFEIREN